jgi:hypothetical protein
VSVKSLLWRCALVLLLGGGFSCSKKKSSQSDELAKDAASVQLEATSIDAPTPEDLGYGEDVRLFDSPAEAMKPILALKPKIIGFGEYHKLANSAPVQSALRRFADEILDVVGPQTAHLVLETWSVDPKCGSQGKAVTKKVEETIQRPKETENEMQILMRKAQEHSIRGHVLQFSCEEYSALLTKGPQAKPSPGKNLKKKKPAVASKSLDTEKLLETVSKKLGEQALLATKATKTDKMILLYGGATHNNLFPYPGLEAWSYAQELAAQTGESFMEVDLYVPEFVEGDTLLSQEAWYPLLKEARKGQVILIRRDATSYIMIMRKEYAELSAVPSSDGHEDGQKGHEDHEDSGEHDGTANP